MMKEVERLLDVKGEADEWRKQMISTIAAWAIDHPGDRVETSRVFSHLLKRMREAIFTDKRAQVAKLARNVVDIVQDERTKEEREKRGPSLDAHSRAAAQEVLTRLEQKFGYCRKCAGDMMSMLVRKRLFS
jgi:RNA polymerase-binding transcription factor DksA